MICWARLNIFRKIDFYPWNAGNVVEFYLIRVGGKDH